MEIAISPPVWYKVIVEKGGWVEVAGILVENGEVITSPFWWGLGVEVDGGDNWGEG